MLWLPWALGQHQKWSQWLNLGEVHKSFTVHFLLLQIHFLSISFCSQSSHKSTLPDSRTNRHKHIHTHTQTQTYTLIHTQTHLTKQVELCGPLIKKRSSFNIGPEPDCIWTWSQGPISFGPRTVFCICISLIHSKLLNISLKKYIPHLGNKS